MKRLKIAISLSALLVFAVTAAVVIAQLADVQTASGNVSVTSTSADLYICEPGTATPPGCGSDDNGGDEAIFETLEDIRPGQIVWYDIRMKNIGDVTWTVMNVTLTITETSDPGGDCPDDALGPGVAIFMQTPYPSQAGVYPHYTDAVPGAPVFRRWSSTTYTGAIKASPSGYNDVSLALQLSATGTENCDGNVWNVSWVWTVG